MIVKSIEKTETNTVTFQVEIDAEAFEAAVNKTYLKNKHSINVPGFRKGKAPRTLIESMYGAEVFHDDAINSLTDDAFMFAVDAEALKIVGRPSLTDAVVNPEKTLTLFFETAVYPDVTLGEYKNLEAPYAAPSIADADVDAEMEAIQKRNARSVSVERGAIDGDTAVIDFEGFIDGVPFDGGRSENHQLILGSNAFIPGFEEQLIGVRAGEAKDINLTFPTDYAPELAGKDVTFKVKINELREEQLPDLDDEFAKDVSEFDTLSEYRESLKETMLKKREDSAEYAFKNAVIEKAAAAISVSIPERMLDEKQDELINESAKNLSMQGLSLEQYFSMTGMSIADFRKNTRPTAERKLRIELMLDKVAETEGVEVSDEEYAFECGRIAGIYGVDEEAVVCGIGEETIKRDLRLNKASELIIASAKKGAPPSESKTDASDEQTSAAEAE